jgi:hypothetical protein
LSTLDVVDEREPIKAVGAVRKDTLAVVDARLVIDPVLTSSDWIEAETDDKDDMEEF